MGNILEPFLTIPAAVRHVHICPACGTAHSVAPARHALAHGRQLTCSCRCERQKRKGWQCRPRHFAF